MRLAAVAEEVLLPKASNPLEDSSGRVSKSFAKSFVGKMGAVLDRSEGTVSS